MSNPLMPPMPGTCVRCGESFAWFYEVHVCPAIAGDFAGLSMRPIPLPENGETR